jgi:hypothetical protein
MVVAVMKGALICGKPAGFEVKYSARFFPVSSNGKPQKTTGSGSTSKHFSGKDYGGMLSFRISELENRRRSCRPFCSF